jgi:hypothetical protein
MRRRSALIVVAVVLAACTAEGSPSGFEGVPISNPRDLPVTDDFVVVRPGANGGSLLRAVSGPIGEAVAYRFSLGHCGLLSPIDVDGSFWDPLDGTGPTGAELDLDSDGEMINATGGVIVVIGDEMRFRTDSGSVVRFERHPGDKEYPGCD